MVAPTNIMDDVNFYRIVSVDMALTSFTSSKYDSQIVPSSSHVVTTGVT